MAGYSVQLDGFEKVLRTELDPAVGHFSRQAEQLRALQGVSPPSLVGSDTEQISSGFTVTWQSLQEHIITAHTALETSLKTLDDALWDAYHYYKGTEEDHSDKLRSAGNF